MLVSHQINGCEKITVTTLPVYMHQASLEHTFVQSQLHGELACQ